MSGLFFEAKERLRRDAGVGSYAVSWPCPGRFAGNRIGISDSAGVFVFLSESYLVDGMELYVLIRKARQKVGSEIRLLQRDVDVARGKRGFRKLLEEQKAFCDGAERAFGDRTVEGPVIVSAHVHALRPLPDGTFVERSGVSDAWRAVRLLPDGEPVYEASGGAALPSSLHGSCRPAACGEDGRDSSGSGSCRMNGPASPDRGRSETEGR